MDNRNDIIKKAATAIFTTFGKAPDAKRTQVLLDLARDQVTPDEYRKIERAAFDLAAAEDTKNGFKPAAGAKGRDRYGPRQKTMQVRGAERRAVFGVLRQSTATVVPDPKHVPSFEQALLASRRWLADKGVKWNGAARKPREAVKAETVAGKAVAKVMAHTLQQPGESMADYMMRIAGDLEHAKAEATGKVADDLATKMVWQHGLALSRLVAEKIMAVQHEPEHA